MYELTEVNKNTVPGSPLPGEGDQSVDHSKCKEHPWCTCYARTVQRIKTYTLSAGIRD